VCHGGSCPCNSAPRATVRHSSLRTPILFAGSDPGTRSRQHRVERGSLVGPVRRIASRLTGRTLRQDRVEQVALQRMQCAVVNDRRKMFELFTLLKVLPFRPFGHTSARSFRPLPFAPRTLLKVRPKLSHRRRTGGSTLSSCILSSYLGSFFSLCASNSVWINLHCVDSILFLNFQNLKRSRNRRRLPFDVFGMNALHYKICNTFETVFRHFVPTLYSSQPPLPG
jgi:hypothetical protein